MLQFSECPCIQNLANNFQAEGSNNPGLSSVGREQCKDIDFQEKTLSGVKHIKQVMSSPLHRSVETAVQLFRKILYKNLKIVVSPELVSHSGLIGVTRNDFSDPLKRYGSKNIDSRRVDGESLRSGAERVLKIGKWLLEQKPSDSGSPYEAALVSHRSFIKYLLAAGE